VDGTLYAFAVPRALSLFVLTFVLNTVAEMVRAAVPQEVQGM